MVLMLCFFTCQSKVWKGGCGVLYVSIPFYYYKKNPMKNINTQDHSFLIQCNANIYKNETPHSFKSQKYSNIEPHKKD